MKSSSSKASKVRKAKETQYIDDKPKRQKREGRSLAQDLIDQCPSSSLGSKKVKANEEGLEDRFEHLGDIWTKIRGHELFVFGYVRRNALEPVNNLWGLNLGKLAVANVFVNVELMKSLANNYDPRTKTIYDYTRESILSVTREIIDTVFNLDWGFKEQVDTNKLAQEYFNLEDIYKRWRLPIHRPRVIGSIVPFGKDEKAPYDVNLFHPYFKYTYYYVAQVLGIEAHPLMDIAAMVIYADLQSKDPQLFDFSTYLVDAINHGLEKLKGDVINVHFKYYYVVMHMLLYVGQDKGLWLDELCIKAYAKTGIRKPMQLWTSSWDQRYNNNQYWHFEEYFVKTLYKLLGYPCDHVLSPEI